MSGPARPPALAGWLLDRLAGPHDAGALRGDLDEEYVRFIEPSRGRWAAALWYWRQTVRSVPAVVGQRLRGPARAADPWWSRRRSDFAYALRALGRRRAYTAAAALTFALALGANTAVFSVVHGILLRPLPFANSEELVRIHPDELFYMRLADAQRFQRHASALTQVVPWGRNLFTFTSGGEAFETRGALVQWDHFEMLGTAPVLGRGFTRDDAATWPYDVVVLGHGLWMRQFGGDAAVLQSPVELNGRQVDVIGIMGPDHVAMEPDWTVWAPLPTDATEVDGVALAANARVRTGVSVQEAQVATRQAFAAAWLEDGYTARAEDLAAIRVIPLRDHLLGSVARPLWVLLGAVIAVLLLACANIANLLLAQGRSRAPEMAVRAALGAPRRRILWQLVLEVGLVAGLGGALGTWAAWMLLQWTSGHLPAYLPRTVPLGLDGPVLVYTLSATVCAAVVAGVLPSIRTAAGPLSPTLGAARGRPGSHRLSGGLIAAEVALSVVLVVGAGLLLRSLQAMSAVDPGFEAAGAVAVRVAPRAGMYEDTELSGFYRRVREAALGAGGIQAAGAIMFLPMSPGGAWSSYVPQGRVLDAGEEAPSTAFRVVTPGYFDAMGIDVLQGRAPTDGDGPDVPLIAVVNQRFAREAFASGDPVGRVVTLGSVEPTRMTVVGVVEDVRQTDLREEAFPEIYLPLAQAPMRRMFVVARTDGDPGQALVALGDAVRSVDPSVVLSRATTLEDLVETSSATLRLLTRMLTLFGFVALALGSVGVFSVTAHVVSQRKREIGIRMALGANPPGVVAGTVIRGMAPVAVGLVFGLVSAGGAGRVLGSLLFDVSRTDPVTMFAVAGLMAVVAGSALALPALQAGRVDPVRTLREE